ncbi:MAG: hypothetical protein KatS3mg022_1652 [Armatimonadota bacterium]|nr:MAG: hypothetical protein KatS3mg022_1652 [Armatimonadota bacterium]GIV19085.1 MAG: hypothetical protein KatS3mg023_0836 [Armatimonadota bacterium]
MGRALVALMLVAVQVLWLFPTSGAAQWLARYTVGNAEQLYSSYGTYLALWGCWALLAWRILSLRVDTPAAGCFRRVLTAFPLLLIWDGLFSRHPSYPVEAANGLLACWVSAAVVSLLATKVPRHITDGCILMVLASESLFALHSWDTERRIMGGFSSPNLFYPLMLYGMLCSTEYVLRGQQVYDLVWGILGCLFATALGASGSRGGMLAGIVAVCWMMYKVLSRARSHNEVPLVRWKVVTLLALLVPLAIGWHLRQEQVGVTTILDRSVHARPILWWTGLRVAWASHGLGCGIANMSAQEQLNDLRTMVLGSGNMEPKNLLVAMVAIYGMPGLWYVLSLIAKSWRFFGQQNDEQQLAGTAMLLALLVAGAADTPILIAERLAPTFLWLQWMMISVSPRPSIVAGLGFVRSRTLRYRVVFTALTAVLLTIGSFVGYTYREARSYQPSLQRLRTLSTTPLSAYPRTLVHLLIEREDKRFWDHAGIDWRAMHRALRTNIRTLQFAQGGSTITQQMVRSMLLDPRFAKSKSLTRKAIELWLATWAERELGKQKILELYLQYAFRLDLPPERIGFGAIARYYFGKPIGQLSPDECAVLVGWLSAPPVKGIDWYRTIALRNATLSGLDREASPYYGQPVRIRVGCFAQKQRE